MTLYTPSQMITTDADVLLAIKHVSKQLAGTTEVICKHVYGHQDSSQGRVQKHAESVNDIDSEDSEQESEEESLQYSDTHERG